MLRFIIRRLLVTMPMVLVVITLTWGLIRLAPGNFYASERALPAAIEQNIRAKYGLDQPWYVQYGRMMGNTLRGDFGTSLSYEDRRSTRSWRRPSGLGGHRAAGLPAGPRRRRDHRHLAALKQNSKLDYGSMALAMLGISLPNFVLGPLLVLVFSLTLYWLPPARWDGFPSRSWCCRS